ncbi:MAG: ArnT family glycosyltransferase, partial [Acidobacteriota bacterium]
MNSSDDATYLLYLINHTNFMSDQNPKFQTAHYSAIISLATIMVCAFTLRFWGLNHHIHTDENKVVNPSAMLANGEQAPLLYPRGSYYPHLYHYVLAVAFIPAAIADDEQTYKTDNNSVYMLIARVVTAFIGSATVLLVFFLGRLLGGTSLGLLAALFFAALPIHVKYSHYAHVDTPLTLMAMLTLYSGIRLWQKGTARWYLMTGALVGLSASTHYPGFALGIVLLIAHMHYVWLAPQKINAFFRPAFLVSLCMIPLSFILTSPYLVVDWKHTWETYTKLNQRALTGDLGYTRTSILWPLYTQTPDWGIPFTKTGLIWETHPLLFLLAFLGLLLSVLNRRWDIAALVGLTAIVFYLAISGYVRMTAIKRLLPITPLISLLGAYALLATTKKWQLMYKAGLIGVIIAIIFLQNTWELIGFNVAYSAGSTHDHAVHWTEHNLPEGSVVLQHTPIRLLNWDDPRFNTVRLNEVYASFNPDDPEVGRDRARPLDSWLAEEQLDFIVLDSRIVDRYY